MKLEEEFYDDGEDEYGYKQTVRAYRADEVEELVDDVIWRLNDICDSLVKCRYDGESLYGLDEWSAPIVNLKSAINILKGGK